VATDTKGDDSFFCVRMCACFRPFQAIMSRHRYNTAACPSRPFFPSVCFASGSSHLPRGALRDAELLAVHEEAFIACFQEIVRQVCSDLQCC